MRDAQISRRTAETDIALRLELDGTGRSEVSTGCGFLDHMLTLFARHGRFDLTVTCQGDTWVDDHHTVEDVGICLGDAFVLAGENSHHIIEGAFKSLARSLGAAAAIDPRFSQEIPSTKGVL